MLDLKVATLRALDAAPTADVRNIAADLRDDWPAVLRANGFDTTQPTAWIAEGLLMYLPAQAQDRLFDDITALSPPRSMLATEFVPTMDAFTSDDGRWKKYGFLRRPGQPGVLRGTQPRHRVPAGAWLGGQRQSGGGTVRGLRDRVHTDTEVSEKFEGFQYISATLS